MVAPMKTNRKVRIVTFGCQMNVYDSQRMLQLLQDEGYTATEENSEADLIVINTCSVREVPSEKVFSLLGRLKILKEERPDLLVGVAGCVAREQGQSIVDRAPCVDIVLGPDHVGEIGRLVERRLTTGRPVVAVEFEDDLERIFPTARPLESGNCTAFVTIMKGCEQFCTYCIVPLVRGQERSKPLESVLQEVSGHLDAGVAEITLLGQNVNRYGIRESGSGTFPELLDAVHDLPGLKRLRFITSHPSDCSDELVERFSSLPKLTSYFHLPIQSGSDRILKAMNRHYDSAHYFDRVDRLRQVRPDIALSTDLIVGFPGETDEDFELTMEAAKRVRWSMAYSFKYSPRPGTKASRLIDDVPAEVKGERLQRLQEVLRGTIKESIEGHIGKVEEVLVEGASVRASLGVNSGQLVGRTSTNIIVNFDVPEGGNVSVGDLVLVKILQAHTHSLLGKLEQ